MRAVTLAGLLLLGTGCSYAEQRINDFADIWRAEISFGIGLQAHAGVGELGHIGVGSSRRHMAGLHYGKFHSRFRIEDHFPLSYIWSLADTDDIYLHRVLVEDDPSMNHHGYVVFPGEVNKDEWDVPEIHYLNIEAGFQALILGFEFGFSIGELVDWILGWFKFSDEWTFLDLGKDDLPEQRKNRALRVKRKRRLGSATSD